MIQSVEIVYIGIYTYERAMYCNSYSLLLSVLEIFQ